MQDTLNYTGRPDRGSKLSPANCSKWATVTPMSALAAEVEAVEAEDMEVGLDYWLPGDVELQQMRLQQTRESFDPLSG